MHPRLSDHEGCAVTTPRSAPASIYRILGPSISLYGLARVKTQESRLAYTAANVNAASIRAPFA